MLLAEDVTNSLLAPLKYGQAKLTKIVQFFLITGMFTMFLLMTIITMTPLLERFNMKVMSHTGGLYNILRYKIKFQNGGDVYRTVDDSGGNDAKYVRNILIQSNMNYRGEDGMQVNEWLTMVNRRYVRQLDPVLTIDTRPEPIWKIAVQQPPTQDDRVHEAPAVGHGGVPAVRGGGVHDDQEDAWQGGHVAGNVRGDVPTAGEDTQDQEKQDEGAGVDDANVQAKEADDNDDHDDTNDTVVVGPGVPIQEEGGEADDTIVHAKKANAAHDDTNDTVVVGPEVSRDEGGEDDPVQGMIETGGRKSMMTKQEMFDPIRPELTGKNSPNRPPVQGDHVDKVPDVRVEEVQDNQEVPHQENQAVAVHDDVTTGGGDDQDQGRLVEDVTKDAEPNGGSARHRRSPKYR
jgi:hypothetical protein